jgi:hypothetical protein
MGAAKLVWFSANERLDPELDIRLLSEMNLTQWFLKSATSRFASPDPVSALRHDRASITPASPFQPSA